MNFYRVMLTLVFNDCLTLRICNDVCRDVITHPFSLWCFHRTTSKCYPRLIKLLLA